MNNQYITIKQAAVILGVTPLTLRNWDKNGKLKASRHPMNNYRVYKIEDLEEVIKEIESGTGLRKKAEREFKKIIIQHITD
jgi:MerR family copper efflux transcriptional regulator